MRGWATDIHPGYGKPETFTAPVVGLVCSTKTPASVVAAKIEAAPPDTLWVLRGKPKKGDPVLPVLPLMNYVVAEKDKQWGNWSESWRNTEILTGCSRVIVFHTPGSITDWFADRADLWSNLIVMRPHT